LQVVAQANAEEAARLEAREDARREAVQHMREAYLWRINNIMGCLFSLPDYFVPGKNSIDRSRMEQALMALSPANIEEGLSAIRVVKDKYVIGFIECAMKGHENLLFHLTRWNRSECARVLKIAGLDLLRPWPREFATFTNSIYIPTLHDRCDGIKYYP